MQLASVTWTISFSSLEIALYGQILIFGSAHWPANIPEAISQAYAAAPSTSKTSFDIIVLALDAAA
ncbi:hypothetical protein ES703_45967 [subsurface metagenome]